MTKSGHVLSGKPVVFSIPIDFCIEFWNSTFSPVLEFTEGIFVTASARAFQWCKPRMRSCFRSKVIQVFLAANSTWTYYSKAIEIVLRKCYFNCFTSAVDPKSTGYPCCHSLIVGHLFFFFYHLHL